VLPPLRHVSPGVLVEEDPEHQLVADEYCGYQVGTLFIPSRLPEPGTSSVQNRANSLMCRRA
jgi:hypothetical protein